MLVDPSMISMLSELRIPGEPDPVAEILDVFATDGEAVLGRIGAAHAARDADGLRRAAHRLKGAAANVGATELATLLYKVEKGAGGGRIDELAGDVKKVPTLFRASLDALHSLA